jgi:hypothetical protein
MPASRKLPRISLLREELKTARLLLPYSAETASELTILREAAEAHRRFGKAAVLNYVISKMNRVSDLLASLASTRLWPSHRFGMGEHCRIHRRTGPPSLRAHPAHASARNYAVVEDEVALAERAARGRRCCRATCFPLGERRCRRPQRGSAHYARGLRSLAASRLPVERLKEGSREMLD